MKDITTKTKYNIEKFGHGLVLVTAAALFIALAIKGSYDVLNTNSQLVSRNAYVGAGVTVLMLILVGIYARKALQK